MAILLFSDPAACATTLPNLVSRTGEHLLLYAGDGAVTTALPATPLATALGVALPNLLVVDLNSDRFRRINFDVISSVTLDLDAESLLASSGRRLVEMLSNLASLDDGAGEMALAFVGGAAGAAGGVLLDGLHAGLNLIPGTAVAPNLAQVADLRGLLESMSAGLGRLLALDAPVGIAYARSTDQVSVAGPGSALLVAFVPSASAANGEESPPTARLHVVTGGMTSTFPDA